MTNTSIGRIGYKEPFSQKKEQKKKHGFFCFNVSDVSKCEYTMVSERKGEKEQYKESGKEGAKGKERSGKRKG